MRVGVGLSLALCLAGCAKKEPVPVAPPPVADGQPPPDVQRVDPGPRPLLLWEVEKDGAVSHLLGTCHLPIPLDHALPEPHRPALTQARLLYTELDGAEMQGTEALGLLWSEDSLRSKIGDEAWTALVRSVRSVLPAPTLEHFPAWAVWGVVELLDADEMAQLQSQAAQGQPIEAPTPILDTAVQLAGEAAGVEHRPLETAQMQVDLLSDFEAEFVTVLQQRASPDTAEGVRGETLDMRRACTDADADAILQITEASADEPMMGALLEKRNVAWMEVLRPELPQGGVLVAAGAGHMVGPKGLVSLLQADGYRVRALEGPGSSWTPPASEVLAANSVSVAEPVDPALVEGWAAQLTPGLTPALCSAQGPVAQCFLPEGADCEQRIADDLFQCIDQYAPDLPPLDQPLPQELGMALGGCASGGLILESMVRGTIGDAPICQQIKAGMEAVSK